MASNATTVQDLAAQRRENELKAAQKTADESNKSRSGVGTRLKVGQTRGKSSQVISWEAFDESLPESLPKTLTEFLTVTGLKDEKDAEARVLGMVIAGYNDEQYTAASDPIAEYVNPQWKDEIKAQFRLIVRNYSRATDTSIEDTATLMRGQLDKKEANFVGK